MTAKLNQNGEPLVTYQDIRTDIQLMSILACVQWCSVIRHATTKYSARNRDQIHVAEVLVNVYPQSNRYHIGPRSGRTITKYTIIVTAYITLPLQAEA